MFREPMPGPLAAHRTIPPPDRPHTCQHCGAWPATLHTPTGRVCETCAEEA